mmetsp:Transcript_777/g.2170  ORF Transcript_777/g.2170 Transcript_777/m.2170 type:complete len:90 (+) Transcript_777:158-427(+)
MLNQQSLDTSANKGCQNPTLDKFAPPGSGARRRSFSPPPSHSSPPTAVLRCIGACLSRFSTLLFGHIRRLLRLQKKEPQTASFSHDQSN